MKKEVLLAIIIGFALGLVITFGIWTANKALKQTAPQKEAPVQNELLEPTPTSLPALSLTITEPEDNSISEEDEIEISGQTAPGSTVALLYETDEEIIEADEKGLFTTTIPLEGGSNEIEIISFDQEGNEASQTLTIVYTTAEI